MITRDDIAELDTSDRLRLIGELWDSISDADAALTPNQRDELLRRLSSFDDDKQGAVSWQALSAELDARKR